ncbi:hypothetical protein [Streptomyces sp. NPDC047028]|uniref:hypothetical protein n=1 Tax=Streptomyces sp. NPDC047028 TaxID=3155793 RepID=UPI0033D2FC99
MPAPAAPSSPAASRDATGMLRRARLLLSSRWRRRPAPAAPTRQVQVQALAGILDDGVAAQEAAEHAIAACSDTGFIPSAARAEAAAQLTVYHHLIIRLRALPLARDLLPLGERASRLLAHHEWILNQAVTLARAPRRGARLAAGRQPLTGLGTAADDLRAVHQEVHVLAGRISGEREQPQGEGAPP